MGLSELPDMHNIDDPDGTLTAAGAGMALPAANIGIAAAPRFRFIQLFQRVISLKGKNEKT